MHNLSYKFAKDIWMGIKENVMPIWQKNIILGATHKGVNTPVNK